MERSQTGGDKSISNVRVGRAQGKQTAASHTPGVKQGNAPGNRVKEEGIFPAPAGAKLDGARANARRSTSINPEAHDPIDPRMPKLSPA